MDGVGCSPVYGKRSVIVAREGSPCHIAAEKNVVGLRQELLGGVGAEIVDQDGSPCRGRVIVREIRPVLNGQLLILQVNRPAAAGRRLNVISDEGNVEDIQMAPPSPDDAEM